MMMWLRRHPRAHEDHLGFIPNFFSMSDPRPAKEQIAEKYVGGWHPMPKFTMLPTGDLRYPGDPVLKVLWEAHLRDEIIYVYEHAWVAVVQKDGSFEASRLD